MIRIQILDLPQYCRPSFNLTMALKIEKIELCQERDVLSRYPPAQF